MMTKRECGNWDKDIGRTMAPTESDSKKYEAISTTKDPYFANVLRAIGIVKAFIIEQNCIVYGGTAIDYALRLKGDKIYPDEALLIPDLDFYSPDSVTIARVLAERLYNAGFENARAIVAIHIQTMKIDIGDNHWVADISYVPKSVFDKLPTLIFDGMRIIDPYFQRIDLHSSLSYPYDNPPRESIFDRWKKDISRFSLLDKYYPVDKIDHLPSNALHWKTAKVPIRTLPLMTRSCIVGFAAYAIIYSMYDAAVPKDHPSREVVIPSKYSLEGDWILFETLIPGNFIELAYSSSDPVSDSDLVLPMSTDWKFSRERRVRFMELLPMNETISVISGSDSYSCFLEHISHKLLTTMTISGMLLASVQYQLMFFLKMYHLVSHHAPIVPKHSITNATNYLLVYRSLLAMVDAVPINPSIDVSSNNDNYNDRNMYDIYRNAKELGKVPVDNMKILPTNYKPATSVPIEFDYEKSIYFIADGRLMDD